METRLAGWLLLVLLLEHTLATPLPYLELENLPRGVVSELGQRLVSHSLLTEGTAPGLQHSLLPEGAAPGLAGRLEAPDARLGLPSPQEIDAIKKVAQILVMLGEQVIPTIIGDVLPAPAPAHSAADPVQDAPNDPVNQN